MLLAHLVRVPFFKGFSSHARSALSLRQHLNISLKRFGCRCEARLFASGTIEFGVVGRILAQGLDLDHFVLQHMFVQYPGLAKLSAGHVLDSLTFLHEKAHIPKAESLAAVVRAAPELLIADVEEDLEPTLAVLGELLPPDELIKLLCASPLVLLRKPAEIQDLVNALAEINLEFEDLVARSPRVSLCKASVVHDVYRCLQDFAAGPGMNHETASISILVNPGLLFCDTAQIGAVASFLRDVMGVTPSSLDCARFFAMENAVQILERTVELLQERGFGLDDIRENMDVLAQIDE